MKRSVLLLFIAILCAARGIAQHIDIDEAKVKGEKFLLTKGVKDVLVPFEENESMRMAKGANVNLRPSYYVFNCENAGGYVIVASNKSNQPILAYSNAGTLSVEEMPAQLKSLLADYERVMQQKNNISVSVPHKTDSQNSIAPLITTEWDQDRHPYNTYCPVVDGVRSAAGCVSVAMAQVMNYHKWPEKTKSAIPAREKYNLPQVPEGTEIDWGNMLDVYGASYTDEEAAAVGRLMLYCGQSLSTTVYHAGTGATMYEVETSLREIFDYDDDVQHVKRSSYSIAQWRDLIYNELKAGRPVIMSGVASDASAHAFVCDGYDGEGLFHINWGWSGVNGYYSIELLSPSLEVGYEHMYNGEAYSYDREAIIGIHRPDGIPANKKNDRRLTTSNIIIDGTALYPEMLTGSVTETFDFEYGFGILLADGAITPLVVKQHKDMFYGNSAAVRDDLKFDLNGLFEDAGVYKVIPISRIMGNETWFRNTPGNIYVEVVAGSGGNITSVQLKEEKVDLEITELKILGSLIAYTPHAIEATVKNNGGEFCGTLYMNAGGGLSSTASVSLVAGGSGKFYFPVGQLDAGNYTAKIYTDENFGNPIGTLIFDIKELIYSDANLSVSHDLDEVVAGRDISFNITATNNGERYLNAIRLEIKCDGLYFDVQEFYVEIDSGTTVAIPVKLSGLSEGKNYYAAIYYYSNDNRVTATEFSFTCAGDDVTAVKDVKGSVGDGVYYDLSGCRVENPGKGIYIVNGRKVLVR